MTIEEFPDPFLTARELDVQRDAGDAIEIARDFVAEERPVTLRYQGVPHVVLLASPGDLEDLAVGFTLSEGIVASVDEIQSVSCAAEGEALAVNLHIAAERFSAVLRRERNLSGRSGCGLCGIADVNEAVRALEPVRADVRITRAELHAALTALPSLQSLNRSTGSVHAAAFALADRGIQLVREDVGRHNALDKVIGALARANIDAASGYFIITSRASYEMVQKAATVGVSMVIAVSAPTGLAIDLAERTGVTLIGFARGDRQVIYTHPERLLR